MLSNIGVHISVFSDLLGMLKLDVGKNKLTKEELSRITTRQVYERYITPLFRGSKVSLCQHLQEHHPTFVGESNVYIIHSWNGSFYHLVDSLTSHFREKLSLSSSSVSSSLSSSNYYLWFDVFSINQYTIPFMDVDWWRQLKYLINQIGHTVLVLCPWDRPHEKCYPLQRTWCLYELYCVSQSKKIFNVAMPRRHKERFIKALHSNYESIDRMIGTIDLELTKSSLPHDKDRVIDFVKKMDGLQKLNSDVFLLLKEWLIEHIRNVILKEISSQEESLKAQITLGRVLRSQAKYDEADKIFYECLYGDSTHDLLTQHPHHRLMIMNHLGFIYKKQLKYDLAEPLITACVEESIILNGHNHDLTLEYKASLADLYFDKEDYIQAEQLYVECISAIKQNRNIPEKVLHHQEKVLQPTSEKHLSQNALSSIISSLANLYTCQGKFEEALPLYIEQHELNEERLDKYDPILLTSLHDLAVCYSYQGSYLQAEPKYLVCLEKRKLVLGEGHADTLSVMNNLAILYDSMDELKKAEKLHKDCLHLRRQYLGQDHKDTLSSMINLATFYKDRECWSEAEEYLHNVIEIQTKKYSSPAHPAVLNARISLAQLFQRHHDFTHAEILYKDCYTDCMKTYGIKHIETIRTMDILADFYASQNMNKEAEHYYWKSVEAKDKLYGKLHSETIEALDTLTSFCVNIQEYESATTYLKMAVERRKRTLSYDHTDVLITMSNLAKIYKLQNKISQSEKIFKECLDFERNKTSATSLTIIPYAVNLASHYRSRKKYANAELLYNQCLNILIYERQEYSSKYFQIKNNLANLYCDQRKFREAEELYLQCIYAIEHQQETHINNQDCATTILQYKINIAILYCNHPDNFPDMNGVVILDDCIRVGTILLGPNHSLLQQWIITREYYAKKSTNSREQCAIS